MVHGPITGEVGVEVVLIADDVVVADGTQIPDGISQASEPSQSELDSQSPLEIGCSIQTDSLQTKVDGQFASSVQV